MPNDDTKNKKYDPCEEFYSSPIPDPIMSFSKVSFGARCLYGVLVKLNRMYNTINPKISFLSESIGCSDRQVSRFVKELTDKNLIKTVRSKTFNYYELLTLEGVDDINLVGRRDNSENKDMTDTSEQSRHDKSVLSSTQDMTDLSTLKNQDRTDLSCQIGQICHVSYNKNKRINKKNVRNVSLFSFSSQVQDLVSKIHSDFQAQASDDIYLLKAIDEFVENGKGYSVAAELIYLANVQAAGGKFLNGSYVKFLMWALKHPNDVNCAQNVRLKQTTSLQSNDLSLTNTDVCLETESACKLSELVSDTVVKMDMSKPSGDRKLAIDHGMKAVDDANIARFKSMSADGRSAVIDMFLDEQNDFTVKRFKSKTEDEYVENGFFICWLGGYFGAGNAACC